MTPFLKGYLTAAMWTEDPSPGQGEYTADLSKLPGETLARALRDAERFMKALSPELEQILTEDPEQCGHDFWLTRNGHGAGFWDRAYPARIGDEFTQICHKLGECNGEFRKGRLYFY